MIKNNLIYITVILNDSKPHGVIMFRNSFTSYDNKNSIEVITFYNGQKDVLEKNINICQKNMGCCVQANQKKN